MLNVYFEATRTWLAKLVKVPLLSFLQDSSADLDLSSKANVAHSKGFAKKFGALLARRPTNDALAPGSKAAIVHETKLMKLRVRAKGISDALIKAIEKQEIPTGILEFWKRLSSDGVYFPACVRTRLLLSLCAGLSVVCCLRSSVRTLSVGTASSGVQQTWLNSQDAVKEFDFG